MKTLHGPIAAALAVVICGMLIPATAGAQDVPGIEICTVEKTMERRTSCLQSNVEFLQKTIAKLAADHQQKLDAANRQIDSLKITLSGLQKVVDDLKKAAEEAKKKDAPAAKDTAPAKDAAPAKNAPAAK
jgi:TolA-binding protein